MRRAFHGGFIQDNRGIVVGIDLGGDHCAEHEFGISPLADAFGLNPSKLGIEKFICHNTPEPFTIEGIINRKKSLLVAFHALQPQKFAQMVARGDNARVIAAYCRILPYDNKEPFTAAWDDHSFAILAQGTESIRALKFLVQAWKEKDFCMMLGQPKTPFGSPGLCLIRASAFSEEEKNAMMQTDLDYQKLLKAAEKTGIKKKLDKAGLKYYALSPQWRDYFKEPVYSSKYPVIFFLNPQYQDQYQSGWFTVEELELWIKGKGPVMKTA